MTADASGGSDASTGGFGEGGLADGLAGNDQKSSQKGEDQMVTSGGDVASTEQEDSAQADRGLA